MGPASAQRTEQPKPKCPDVANAFVFGLQLGYALGRNSLPPRPATLPPQAPIPAPVDSLLRCILRP